MASYSKSNFDKIEETNNEISEEVKLDGIYQNMFSNNILKQSLVYDIFGFTYFYNTFKLNKKQKTLIVINSTLKVNNQLLDILEENEIKVYTLKTERVEIYDIVNNYKLSNPENIDIEILIDFDFEDLKLETRTLTKHNLIGFNFNSFKFGTKLEDQFIILNKGPFDLEVEDDPLLEYVKNTLICP
ncbi:hypothetical protein [Carp edema virus]|nr:hypothetical protein [Carp edema virus]